MSFSGPYVTLPFTTDPNDLADDAIDYLQAQWPNWTPSDANGEVVLIEALAPMAANAAQIASNMPPAALIAYGTQILGIPYQAGVAATTVGEFVVQDANGPYDIPAGSEIDLGGVAFQTVADLTIPNGQTTGSVTLQANDPGVVGNDLTATGWAPITLPVYVTGLTLATPTSDGVDPQDDDDYLNMVAQEMQLRAKSTITLPDLEIVAVNTPGIGRCVVVAQNGTPRNLDVYVTDPTGLVVPSSVKTTLADQYAETRMVNAVISILDPAFTTVGVTYEALALPGVDAATLQAQISAALASLLSAAPGGWGTPSAGQIGGLTWVDQPVVHLNKVIGAISGVVGVDYVVSAALTSQRAATLSSALSTSGPITQLPVTTANAIPSGVPVTVIESVPAVGNVVTNPSFEHDAIGVAPAGWTNDLFETTSSTFDVQTGWAAHGSQSLRITVVMSSGGYGGAQTTYLPVLAGQEYAVQAAVNLLELPAGAEIGTTVLWYSSSEAYISAVGLPAVETLGVTEVSGLVTAPAGAAYAIIACNAQFAPGTADYYIDGVAMMPGSTVTAYDDGDSTGWGWSGTPGASGSGPLTQVTQTFTTSGPTAAHASDIPVVSETPVVAFPIGSAVAAAVVGDLVMNQNEAGALPQAGTFTGTIDIPST